MFIIKHISKCWKKAKKGVFYYFKIRFLTLTVKSWTTTKHWNQINRAQFTNYSTYPTSKSTSYSHELLLQRASCHIWQGSWIWFWWRTQLTSFAEKELLHLQFYKSCKELKKAIKISCILWVFMWITQNLAKSCKTSCKKNHF